MRKFDDELELSSTNSPRKISLQICGSKLWKCCENGKFQHVKKLQNQFSLWRLFSGLRRLRADKNFSQINFHPLTFFSQSRVTHNFSLFLTFYQWTFTHNEGIITNELFNVPVRTKLLLIMSLINIHRHSILLLSKLKIIHCLKKELLCLNSVGVWRVQWQKWKSKRSTFAEWMFCCDWKRGQILGYTIEENIKFCYLLATEGKLAFAHDRQLSSTSKTWTFFMPCSSILLVTFGIQKMYCGFPLVAGKSLKHQMAFELEVDRRKWQKKFK